MLNRLLALANLFNLFKINQARMFYWGIPTKQIDQTFSYVTNTRKIWCYFLELALIGSEIVELIRTDG